jgi:hypothetical protein
MKPRRFAMALILALPLVFGYCLLPLMRTSTAAPVAPEDAPFKGKVLVVTMESKATLPLEHARIRKLGDRAFLVGKGCDERHPANWTKGQIVWIPMNRVEMIVEFESVEEMKKAVQASQQAIPATPAPAPNQPGFQGFAAPKQ